jgi:hypothetical protein
LVSNEVDKSLSPVLLQYHNLSIGLLGTHVDGYLRRRLDGWLFELLDEDSRWDLGTRGPQFGQGVRTNIVVPQYIMNLQAGEFAFQLAHFLYISIHCLLVAVPFLVDLLNDKKRVAIYK